MNQKQNPQQPNKVVLELATVNNLARTLHVTPASVRRLVKEGKIQAHRIPGSSRRGAADASSKLYFTKQDVEDYLVWKYGFEKEDFA